MSYVFVVYSPGDTVFLSLCQVGCITKYGILRKVGVPLGSV